MAAASRQQVNVLNTAIRKQAGAFQSQDPSVYLSCYARLAGDGVCARCLLRLVGHTGFEDYALPAPSQAQLLAALSPHEAHRHASACTSDATIAGPATDPRCPTIAGPATDPRCPTCFGLLQTLFEDVPRLHSDAPDSTTTMPQPGGGGVATAAAVPGEQQPQKQQQRDPQEPQAAGGQEEAAEQAGSSAGASAGGPTPAGAGPVDIVWLRIQHRAVQGGPPEGRPSPVAGHEQLSGLPSATELAAAVRRQAEQGPPDRAALALAAAAADDSVCAGSGATAVAVPAGQQQDGPVAEEDVGPPLPLHSFSVEVLKVPAACGLRDVTAYTWLTSEYDSKRVPYPGWKLANIVPVVVVLRRALPLLFARVLGLTAAAPQSANAVVSVAAVDGEAGLGELQVLLKDQAAQHARRQHSHARDPHQQRPDKRQRGNNPHPRGGMQQQQQHQTQRGQGGPGPLGGSEGAGEGAGQQAPPQAEVVISEERLRNLSAEQAANTASAMPRHVLQRLFPWPPPTRPRQPTTTITNGAATNAVAATAAGHAAGTGTTPAAAGAATGAGAGLWPEVYLRVVRSPLLLAGRYCKLRRHMPQSPWFVLATGERIGGTSVQEAVERFVLPLYGTVVAKMVTGGREDADVRMLGAGRPFVMEVQAPVRGHPSAEALRRMEQRMRDSKCGVTVQGLTPCAPSALESIKAAEESKEKTYRALCWAAQPVTSAHLAALEAIGRVESQQDTPVRVLHRRAARVRPKWLQVESATQVTGRPHYFVLQVRTQAGTYVKEFCHGDFGRCSPCLGEILARIRAATPGEVTTTAAAAATAPAEATKAATDVAKTAAAAVAASSNGGAATGAPGSVAEAGGAAGAAGGGGSSSGLPYEHVEIVQLDVIDVHLEDWP